VEEPSGNPPGPPHAARSATHYSLAKTPLAGDKIDAPAACAVPFCPYCGGVTVKVVVIIIMIMGNNRSMNYCNNCKHRVYM